MSSSHLASRQQAPSTYFAETFAALTGHSPFPWQAALYERFCRGEMPEACDLPTGLGKTAVIAIWLLALAQARTSPGVAPCTLPRRLVYVVNRRTVVDQATDEVEQMRLALSTRPALRPIAEALRALAVSPGDAAFALSTLRGQFADNAEWRMDPTRPAVITGTVDMIGSRLLFSGYGCGFKSRPLHAGLLGQDTLLVHDEAHLEPAFQELVEATRREQDRQRDFGRLRVMALSATARREGEAFGLTDAERHPESVPAAAASPELRELWKRTGAEKRMRSHTVGAEKDVPAKTAELALGHRQTGKAVLVFLRTVRGVEDVAGRLVNAGLPVQTLTGTMRGLERDALAKGNAVFARFLRKPPGGVVPQPGTVYLVCTSAGEVGVNISADHLVCDLTPFDSMAQRLGRVNRFGEGHAQVDVVHESGPDEKGNGDPYDQARWRTLRLLSSLPLMADGRRSASPAALAELPATERQAAFTPAPVILQATDILFDAWALTSVRQPLPGRPPVADWLHGVSPPWEPPETYVAWREEVWAIARSRLEEDRPDELLEDYPLKPHELLHDRTIRVRAHLEAIAARSPTLPVWLVLPDGTVRADLVLGDLVAKDGQRRPLVDLDDCTVVLPPEAGGLALGPDGVSTGMLSGDVAYQEMHRAVYDIADEWTDEMGNARRRRVWDDEPPPRGMRLVRRPIDTLPDAEDDEDDPSVPAKRRYWRWYVRPPAADDDGSGTATQRQELEPHLLSVERFARDLVGKLGLSGPEAAALGFAARWHDRGKHRAVWQRSAGNRDYPQTVLAKSASMATMDLGRYRHELGSLLDLQRDPEFRGLASDVQDLALHLIAAHHGRARPYFPIGEAFDPERSEEETADLVREIPRRFARLQRRYGRWGLAYLESLLRAADAMASQAEPEPGPAPTQEGDP